ncbi:hypothetical protein J6590_042558 [Homalodisca vitripennis]|nr:hypothetical protein J6590_042558 [Homalodisca vitripennis]
MCPVIALTLIARLTLGGYRVDTRVINKQGSNHCASRPDCVLCGMFYSVRQVVLSNSPHSRFKPSSWAYSIHELMSDELSLTLDVPL